MSHRTLIRNGRIVTAVDDYHADVLLEEMAKEFGTVPAASSRPSAVSLRSAVRGADKEEITQEEAEKLYEEIMSK